MTGWTAGRGAVVDPEIPLRAFGFPSSVTVTPVGGGFSGALVWRVDAAPATFALKAYPESMDGPVERLAEIHRWLDAGRRGGVLGLPRVFRGMDGMTVFAHRRLWDLVSWQQGEPKLATEPTPARLRAVGIALAKLHDAWVQFTAPRWPSAAIARRWQALDDWESLRGSNVRPDIAHAVNRLTGKLRELLLPWGPRSVVHQPCLGDLWHAHLLFTGDEVTGVIDHGAARRDHPVCDLARLLGSLELTPPQRGELLGAYDALRQRGDADRELTEVLEQAGIVGALIGWARRLASGMPSTIEIELRIASLLRRAAQM